MPFDFKKVARSGALTTITDPAVLFDALPNKAPGYGYLRAVQKTVLDEWSSRRKERDLVIKTNTGGGKTIAGLLILQVCLHEGVGPALYVAPDPHLAEQVKVEAANLGLAAVDDPAAPKFLSGEAICITTMNVLMNGKSRFGVKGSPIRQPVRVRSIVVDDAHAALAMAEEKTYLRIPRGHTAYEPLVTLFEDELKQQGHNAFLDLRENDPSAVLRVPFWAWYDKRDQVLQVLRPHRNDATFEWTWPLVADLIPMCQAVVSADAVEIVPPCPPIEKLPSFDEADRRVYLTATLSDDSVLITHFNAESSSVANSIVPESAADLGDRLVLAPAELCPGATHADVRAEMLSLAVEHNVVVLVPSHKRALLWSAEATRTVSKSADISDVVDALRAGHVGLVVIVNRYDGIDLPDEACRVLVIDGLPQAYTGVERREAVALRDSEAMVTRQLQRLEQGMGRGVRSRDDRCAVILLDPRLTQLVARVDIAERLSPATRAQLALSRRVASDLEGTTMKQLGEVVRQVVDGDPSFRELSRDALVGVTYGPATISPAAAPLRRAYHAAVAGRAEEAAREADEAVKIALEASDSRLAGWLGETLASYLHPLDAVRAQGALTTAAKRNPAVLRPVGGLEYRRVKAAAVQSQQASSYLQARYEGGAEFRLGVEAVLADLLWDEERTEEAEAALAELAEHVGITAQRPERDFGRGSDVLWALGKDDFAVIEAKSGATGKMIWKKDINQLAGSVNWCMNEYGVGATVVPIIMHPKTIVEKSGTPPSGARVFTPATIDKLKDAVRAYATALASNDSFRDTKSVEDQLRQHKLSATEIAKVFSTSATRQQ
ncbi:MAG: DEAD/DEAH box helicase family protein [Acidimicrobiales bacterium]